MTANPLLATGQLPRFGSIRPEHVRPAVRQVLADNRRALEDLLADAAERPADFDRDILALERLGDALHRVWSPISHLHAVCNEPDLRDAYNECLPELARYQTEIAQDERLYRLYRQVADRLADDDRDRPAARRLLELALRDFHLAGVDLPDERKQRFKALMEELTQLQAKFEQNVLDAMASWQHAETDPAAVAGIPATTLEQASAAARAAGAEGWLFRLDQPTYVAVVTHAENRDLRHLFYRAWNTRASDQATYATGDASNFDNSPVIARILELRHEAANVVGFDTFADYSLASKMADSVNEVRGFLEDLGKKSHRAAQAELEELERFAGRALAAWDIAYYAERLRHERFSISDEQLRPYFPLDRVLDGMFSVAGRLYGITVSPVTNPDAWHADVRYYRVTGDDGNQIGGFFTDLYARENKRAGAWMDECVIRRHDDDGTRHPVAHLVCNFAAPTDTTPCLLTHDEVVTLFHEFGHTLHHVLTRVDYSSVSGINGVPWDAVELPSQFMENFAWQPEVVRRLSEHHESGQALPEEMIERLRESRVFHAALQMVRQLEFALFDIRLHSDPESFDAAAMAKLLDEVRAEVAVVRHPDYNRFAHAFAHIFGGGYAAGYYSYKWAEVLAADAWSAFEEQGIFDAETAQRFRRDVLEIGGTRDLGEAFAAFRGREPSIEPLLAQSGIVPQPAGDAA